MRLILALLLLAGCSNNSNLDNQIQQLENAAKSLEFSTISLNCTISVTPEILRAEVDRLALPRTREVALIIIDANVYKCVHKKYDELINVK